MNVASGLAGVLGVPIPVAAALLGAAAALAVTTVARGLRVVRRPTPAARERWRSVGTWWILLVALLTVLLLGRPALVVAMAVVSVLLLRETLSLTDAGGGLPPAVVVAVGTYAWAFLDWRSLFFRAVPLVLLGAALLAIAVRAAPDRGTRLAGARRFGLAVLIAVVGPAHVVGVASAPSTDGSPSSPWAWLVILLLLTELNDIAQAWTGRAFGRHRMAPVLSPAKTWEGLIGGLGTTVVAAALLVPALLPAGAAGAVLGGGAPGSLRLWSAGLGLLVGLSGTGGDLAASALKRAAGVKDSGDLLPGQGGVLDRFDSLVLSAPAFFAFVHLVGLVGP